MAPDIFCSCQKFKLRAVQNSGVRGACLFAQRLVLINIFETGQRLFAVKADIVRKGLDDLEKVLYDFFTAKTTACLTDKTPAVKNFGYFIPPARL